MSDQPFTFDACETAKVCRDGLATLLARGQDWSEIHCGRCGMTGIVRHADLVPHPAENPANVEAPEPVADPVEPAAENPAGNPDTPTDSVAEPQGKADRS